MATDLQSTTHFQLKVSDVWTELTSPLSLFTNIWSASRPVSAGRLIAGPRLLPSSGFLNWTTILGMSTGSGIGSGFRDLEYADRCRLGGGRRVAMAQQGRCVELVQVM